MNSFAEDLKDILADESSLALTFGTDLYVGKEEATPDNCVTIFETPSFPPMMTFEQMESNYFYSSAQIRIRNRDYQIGYDLARNIMTLLHGRANETWNGTLYTVIQAMGEPALLDWDANDRCRFILNINAQRR